MASPVDGSHAVRVTASIFADTRAVEARIFHTAESALK
jgi:hypothetical protein